MSFWKKLFGIKSEQEKQEEAAKQRRRIDAVNALIGSYDLTELFKIVRQNPELLESETDEILYKAVTAMKMINDGRNAAQVEKKRDLLYRCRQIGIVEAFVELIASKNANIPDELRKIFEYSTRLYLTEDYEELARVIHDYPELQAILRHSPDRTLKA